MEKKRIHELAKDLNTNSKRLIEKLNEINIFPKGPMSYLEEDEYNALMNHLGINIEAHKQDKDSEKKPLITRQKDTSKPYTIIKRVVNVIDSDDKPKDKEEKIKQQRRTVESSSGLRPGFVVVQDTSYESLAATVKKKKKPVETKSAKDAVNKAEETEGSKVKEAVKDEKTKIAVEVKKPVKEAVKEVAKEPAKESAKETVKDAAKEIKEVKEVKRDNAAEAIKNEDMIDVKTDKTTVENKEDMAANASDEAKTAKAKQKDSKVKHPKKKPAKETGETAVAEKPSHDRTAEKKKDEKDVAEQAVDTRKDVPAAEHAKTEEIKHVDVQETAAEEKDIKAADPEMNYGDDYDNSKKLKSGKKPEKFYGKKKEEAPESVEKPGKKEKKEGVKGYFSGEKARKFRPEKFIVGEKKKVHEVYSDNFAYEALDVHDKLNRKPKKDKKKNSQVRQPEQQVHQQPVKHVLTNITIPEVLTVKELAEALKKTSAEVIKKLLMMGVVATLNQEIDFATAAIIADEFGVKADLLTELSEEDILFEDYDVKNDPEAVTRPPVVVVMGHVDHGKTSLLDAIRKTNVTLREAGGITQHIGAYMVKLNNRYITFLDTPGHEAFTAMRARGAQVTDIAILVVAADDGIMPQTVEAINHAKAANVSIIVAINKVDKPTANVDRVKQELTEYGLVPEEWGGDVIVVPVSAKTNQNIDTLLEMVLLSADMLELKANPRKQAKGTIIEAKLDKTRGPVATALVQQGTLRIGDSIVTGTTVGRIRAMVDDMGRQLKEAGPSTPVEILGLPDVPEAGEIFHAVKDEKLAKQLAEKRKNKLREEQIKKKSKISLDDLFNQIKEGNVKELNVIVKADVQGSVEAIKQALTKLSNDEVRINVIHDAVGAVTESDVSLAEVSNAIIIGFNVRPGANTISAAEQAGVDMRLYSVIYDAIEDIQAAMKGMLDPTYKEVVQGHAQVRQIYRVSSVGTIAGCYVTDGKITRNSEVRLVRDGIVIYQGKIASLKRFKDDVREVVQNYECGITLERFNDIKENDVIESFIMEEVKR